MWKSKVFRMTSISSPDRWPVGTSHHSVGDPRIRRPAFVVMDATEQVASAGPERPRDAVTGTW